MELACSTLVADTEGNVDTEENVSIGLKLAIELHRNFRGSMEGQAPMLMEFVKLVSQYQNKQMSLSCKGPYLSLLHVYL